MVKRIRCLMTFVGGILADNFSLKKIYLLGIAAQAPCFFCISYFYGLPLIFVCLLAAIFNSSILPTENILLAKFTPEKHHGLIYGVKFIVAFGSGPLAVFLISKLYELTKEFNYIFLINTFVIILITFIVLFLPLKRAKLYS